MTGSVPRADQLARLVQDPRSKDDLREYFGLELGRPFSGAWFETFGGGGDAPLVKDVITAEDVLAVGTLSVSIPSLVALDLVEGQLGREIAGQLRQIPVDVAIGTRSSRALLVDDGPADKAWRALRRADGIGWVIAAKILARKRPALIPVYDHVVRCAYGKPRHLWLELDDRFRSGEALLQNRLDQLREAAGVEQNITSLRLLDIVVWMRHRRDHKPTRCAGVAELRQN